MRYLLLFGILLSVTQSARIRRQNTNVAVICSACQERQKRTPAQVCCRCQDQNSLCNNDIGTPGPNVGEGPKLNPGPICSNDLECRLFSDCDEDATTCPVSGPLLDLRQGDLEECPPGQSLCCNPVPGDLLDLRLGLLHADNPLGDPVQENGRLMREICTDQKLAATINFELGLTCGKRDSRVYYNAVKSEGEGGVGEASNPGEWPWAVLIYRDDLFGNQQYVGAGTLMDNDVVVTTATKVSEFQKDPSQLTIRLGDWDPNQSGPNSRENFPHVEKKVDCIKFHPKFNNRSLEYNVAVIKLAQEVTNRVGIFDVSDVVEIRTGARRPANRPEGVEGFSRNPVTLRQGGGSREDRRELLAELTNEVEIDSFIPRSYINTACLPESRRQFGGGMRCWVAAWGTGGRQQREVDIPLVGRSDCEDILRPIFERKGVKSWAGLSPSELCAGGEGKDTCVGEGGAPLVCLDQDRDQYFAVGMVNYGFGCGQEGVPAVYVNLADPQVQDFITEAFSSLWCLLRDDGSE